MKRSLWPVALALATSAAYADNRLFPTDVLEQGEIDLALTLGHAAFSRHFHWNGYPGTQKLEEDFETIKGRYGLGANWHIGASLQYNSSAEYRTHFQGAPSTFVSRAGEGTQNPDLWATYAFSNGKDTAFSLSGTVGYSPDTTDNHSRKAWAGIAGGWNVGNGLKLYSLYQGVRYDFDSLPHVTTHAVSLGGHQTLTDSLTVTAAISVQHLQTSADHAPYARRGLGMSAQVQVLPNTYLIPGFDLARLPSERTRDGRMYWGATDANEFFLRLYHLM